MANAKSSKNRLKKVAIATAMLMIAVVLLDKTVVGGTTRFYTKWSSCGQKPVTVRGSGFMSVGTPHYLETSNVEFFPGMHDYYCTPIEAERAGYSASKDERSFPNLEKAGEPIPLPNGGRLNPDGSITLPSTSS